LAQAEHVTERGGLPLARRRFRAGVDLWWRPVPTWRLQLRQTWRRRLARAHSAEAPWRPPVTTAEQDEGSLLLRGEHRIGPWRLQTDLRRTRDGPPAAANVRNLVSATLRWRDPGGWEVNAGVASAWGDPEDLITAVALVPGRVLPLHWSRWREGWMLRVGRWRGNLRAHCGVLWRRSAWSAAPTAESPADPSTVLGDELRIVGQFERRW
jgi:hypothetical protein